MGKVIDGRYEIIQKIGEGGMGAVYLAQDLRLKRQVALKRLVFQGKPVHEAMFQKRFEREALAMAAFQHPNIVAVYDYGQDDEGVYLVIEFMTGGVLSELMRDRTYSVEEAIAMLLPLTDALQEIHSMGQVHRDIKPSNILFDKYGNPKLADFGVVKLLEVEEGYTLTATGAAVGTPAYMAPELIGGEASPATDQYALGVVLYELVTGKKPFQGRTPMETLTMQKTDPLPDPRSINPELPEWICEVLKQALAKNPALRYVDVQAFAEVLRAGEPDAPSPAAAVPIPELETIMATPVEEEPIVDDTQTGYREMAAAPRVPHKRSLPAWSLWSALGVVLVGLLIGFWGKLFSGKAEPEATQVAEISTKTQTAKTTTPTIEPSSTNTSKPTQTATKTFTFTPTLVIGSTMMREKDGMEMVYVPEGTFIMGSTEDQRLIVRTNNSCETCNFTFDYELDAHSVFLNGYWMDSLEVTNQQFSIFLNEVGNQKTNGVPYVNTDRPYVRLFENVDGSWYADETYLNHPMREVTWFGAQAYCEWAGGRLPTEAEWEKAARGTDGRIYPWGEWEPTCQIANYHPCVKATKNVGSYPAGASVYGVLDMAGNVEEWTADWYEEDTTIITKGGNWWFNNGILHAAYRGWNTPDYSATTLGFRCMIPISDQ